MADISKFPRGVPGRDLRDNIAPYAQWADPDPIASHHFWRHEPGKIIVGRIGKELIGVNDNRHGLMAAGTRGGKSLLATANACEWLGSMALNDVKGELADRTAGRRGHGSKWVKHGLGQDVHVLDGFGITKHETHSWNALDMVPRPGPGDEQAADIAMLIADGAILQESGAGRHFSSGARRLVGPGVILQVCSDEPPERRNLIRVWELLNRDANGQKQLLEVMADNPNYGGAIARTALSMLGKTEAERSGIFSTAIEQLFWLESEAMRRVLCRSDFQLHEFKTNPNGLTVYLCLPATRMPTHNRWLRIFHNLLIEAMEREKTVPKHDVICCLDEFVSLGYMENIEKAAAQIAGSHLRYQFIVQTLGQIKAIYKDWETFIGNSGLLQFFANADLASLEWASKKLGKSTIMQVSKGEISTAQSAGGFTGESNSLHTTELMTPDEIEKFFSRQSGNQLVLWPGAAPMAMERVKYYEDPFFKGKYDED
jgi:type IV secretion system protein VirD4